MDIYQNIKLAINNFEPMPETEWEAFSSLLTIKEYNQGDFLTRAGQQEQFVYYLYEGATRNYFIKDGKEFTVDFHFAGEFVTGFFSLIMKQPSPVSIELLEDSVIVAIPYARLEEFYKVSVAGATIGRKIAEMQYALRLKKEMDLLSLTAEERYAQLMKKNPVLVSSISVKHLSGFLGIQPESLSRIRRQFGRN